MAHLPTGTGRYTWIKPRTTAHNIMFGTLWVEQEGDVIVCNKTTGDYCVMEWRPYSLQGKAYTTLTGELSPAFPLPTAVPVCVELCNGAGATP